MQCICGLNIRCFALPDHDQKISTQNRIFTPNPIPDMEMLDESDPKPILIARIAFVIIIPKFEGSLSIPLRLH